jgi:hypothetical protein
MTYDVLGYFYDLDKTNIENNLKDVLATLDTMTAFTFERPTADRVKLDSPRAVMTAFPDVRWSSMLKNNGSSVPRTPKTAMVTRRTIRSRISPARRGPTRSRINWQYDRTI